MATERDAASVALDIVGNLASALWNAQWSRYLSLLSRAIAIPFRIAWVPLSYVADIFAVVAAPGLYILSYLLSCCNAVIAFLISLKPLYTFFGTAAAIGIMAGITLAISSSIITSYLSMQDDSPDRLRLGSGKGLLQSSTALIKDESSSNETDYYWTDSSPMRRRLATGLLSQTIIEEEDDSDV